ncbi:peptidoglycan D,D-transpeptidase FtsI family protein [Ructibacterium gallinarum]|uniref:Peptidoglycan glycosyltransferase n=1 Tax=Ructibacterium gallinarum TaxID=2779355 RepID=A0A9D5RAZ0_9FIRM|nr:penicillin-binding transpeptidase domain-containing protein [Ructibacterium gallinarum]MBE5039538.1 peptidoglycan glycosyltransferase [Ructibacterium gallinarum]
MNPNKKIIRVLVVVCVMFLSLVTYLLYFNMFEAEEVATNPYNKRQWEDEKFVKRGTIYDRDGVVLAETEVSGDERIRKYPQGRLYSHVIGYCSKVYGKSQLEMKYDKELLGQGDIAISFNELRSGYDLTLTIDNDLQQYAYDQLNGREGAVVALEPTTGKVLAMVSYPDFDPSAESLEKNWNAIVEREDSPLLARATQGLYPPGSTYKIATAAAAYETGRITETFQDNGKFERDGLSVDNYGQAAYGEIDLKRAFEVSSNYAFCTLGYEMGPEKVLEEAERFGVGKEFGFDIPVEKSEIQYKKMTAQDAALVSIGQGQLLMTPLHVAMMGAAVANGGKMMQPYLVDTISTASGLTLSETKPAVLYDVMDAGCAEYLDTLMQGVVANGTGKSCQISGITVAGKTGTAENETDQDHAWFVGYAPAENPQIAVAVLLEYDGGAGGTNAGPIARNVIRKYLQK